jgi:GH15 family glucan-1,4-alpha-glucosidase
MQLVGNCLVFLCRQKMSALYHYAVELLKKVSVDAGFTATPAQQDNYYRVWTRDAIVCGIACITTSETSLHNTFKRSLQTIWQHQHPSGFLPSNVIPHSNQPGYGNSTGRTDNTCWGIIGACLYAHATNDLPFLDKLQPNIEKAFTVLEAWEYNGKHLVYVPQSGDWADEYIQHGYILYDQLLRLWALQLAAHMLHHKQYSQKAQLVKQTIEDNFFYRTDDENWYSPQLQRMKATAPQNFWWMGFNPSQLYTPFDLQANTLALLLGIGNNTQQQQVIDWISDRSQKSTLMLPSFYPAIEQQDRLMPELQNNFAYHFRNKPHEFHNGGLWPVWNGWITATLLPRDERLHRSLLQKMENALPEQAPGFNECMHGITGEPCGVTECAWSAAGYIIAHNAASFNKITGL